MGEKVDVVITYLRQGARPSVPASARPPGKVAILRVENPQVHYYRYLYDLIGRPWNWVSRRNMSNDALAQIIQHDRVYLYVLYVGGAPAGLAEIDGRNGKEAELRFFGLAPEFIGKGYARFFLSNVVELAWMLNPESVALETCTLDHPAALPLYQKFGFTVFDQRKGSIEIIAPKTPEAQ
ncbi:MAG: GNAT family N-acetyltransferase [Parvularculaceae bacterium]